MKRFLHKDSQALRGAQCYMCVSCRHFGSSECIFVISYFSIFHKRQASKQNNKLSLILSFDWYISSYLPARGAKVGPVWRQVRTGLPCGGKVGSFFNYSRCATLKSTWGICLWHGLDVVSCHLSSTETIFVTELPRDRGDGQVRTNLDCEDAPFPSLPSPPPPWLPINTLCHFRWLLSYCYVLLYSATFVTIFMEKEKWSHLSQNVFLWLAP